MHGIFQAHLARHSLLILVASAAIPAQVPAGIRIDSSSGLRPKRVAATTTSLPLTLRQHDRVVFIGNTLFDSAQDFAYFETMLQQAHPALDLKVRTLAWSADEIDLAPRPANFGSLDQHLMVQQADVIFATYGFNESFAGAASYRGTRAALDAAISILDTERGRHLDYALACALGSHTLRPLW